MFKVKVSAHRLHIRQGAGTAFDSVGLLNLEDELTVLEIDASGTWLKIQGGHPKQLGWSSAKYLTPCTTQNSPWLNAAVTEIGVREYAGSAQNHPRIQQYLASVDDLSCIDKSLDETAWCSCFMNWCVERSLLQGTNSAWAKSWGNWHNGRAPGQARLGDIGVFERTSPSVNGGHVGIFIARTSDEVVILGGNQSDSVRYSRYPMDGFRGETHYKLLTCRYA